MSGISIRVREPLPRRVSSLSLPIVHLIAAARPNFMKVAPLYHELANQGWCIPRLIHTGQHYDVNMSDAFWRDLALPEPAHHLQVGSGTHAQQTGRTMIAYEGVCERETPTAIVVVGDVNATAACALVGSKLWIPVVHLEAGLRSRDRRMPEEINRLVTDAISDLLWTPSPDADANLLAEGIPAQKIEQVGNIMLDSFEMLRTKIEAADARTQLGVVPPYAVVTLHRPSNVDDRTQLSELVQALSALARELTVVFAVHPRTRARLKEFALEASLAAVPGLRLTEPLSYLDFMNLVIGCTLAITDSGGVQEETTYLGIPCATLRENTERPITLSEGTNRLLQAAQLPAAARAALAGEWPRGRRPAGWDGAARVRCAASLRRLLADRLGH
jgi:UDP-N-acetylglucosamine 2-epimerase (non-hydrolysing)